MNAQPSMRLVAAMLVFGLLLGACASRGAGHDEPAHPAGLLHIPPGHMPPPGQCRVWHPDRPPGHQPPPGDCHVLRFRVPYGAYLIRG
jgi:hypothetical protein